MTTLAEAECARSKWRFVDVFRQHYLIAPKGAATPEGWQSTGLGDWQVSHCPSLPCATLTLSGGQPVALLLGHAVTEDALLIEGKHKLPVSVRARDCLDKVERFIEALAGRFTVLVEAKGQARVYPDPVCGHGPVFHAKARRLGAALPLVLDRAVQPQKDAATAPTPLLFGDTPDPEVRRAVPNHYVDLKDFSLVRHWPRADTVLASEAASIPDIAAEMATKLCANMRAIAERHPSVLPITGGMDSRLLLAASRDHWDIYREFLVYHTNWANSFDTKIAQQIAQVLGLPLRVISKEAPVYQAAMRPFEMRQLMKQRLLRGGFEEDTAEKGSVRALSLVPQDRVVLRGNVAEMTRALRWHPSVFKDVDNTAFAMAKLNVKQGESPRYDALEARFLDWKAALPDHALPRLYDMLHTELWVPQANSTGYIRETGPMPLNPFADRRLVQLTMQVPPAARHRGDLVHAMIAQGTPELLDIPYKRALVRQHVQAKKTG